MYDCTYSVHKIRHMQNVKNNKGSFKWIHLLTLQYLKIYKKFMTENKITPPSSSCYLEFCWILNCWGAWQTVIQEDIGGRPCRRPSCSCSCRVDRPSKDQEQWAVPCPPHPLQRGCTPHNGGPWRPRPQECPPALALRSREGPELLS